MQSLEKPIRLAIGLGLAAVVFSKVRELSDQEHSFTASPSISSRKDRFTVLNVKPGEPLKAPMGEFFLNKDGLYIHFRKWIPQGNVEPLPPKGIIVLVHGLAEHCARYDHVAKALNNIGFVVYALDHQGHGRSEGDRLHLKSFDDYVDDVLAVVAMAKRDNPLIKNKTFILVERFRSVNIANLVPSSVDQQIRQANLWCGFSHDSLNLLH